MGRTGSATLPLHGGRVPPWLAQRMAALGRVLVEALVLEYGRDELLRRLAHPYWFQSLGCVMGMDWHSSGITTSVLGALKRGLAPVADELGVHVCGGRGRHSRKTPDELRALADTRGLDGDGLVRASRLVAKVDSAAVQDGHQLYLHGFVVTDDGRWVVVQQGMCEALRTARRYHWLSDGLRSFVEEPHAAIDAMDADSSTVAREIVNLTDRRAAKTRAVEVALAVAGPSAVLPHLHMPSHHDLRASDVLLRRLHGTLAAAAEAGPRDFADLLLVPGVGARTVEALAHVAQVLHGTPSRFTDPARYALAHGGKDGHPYPVPLKVYDRTIAVMRHAVDAARLGQGERLAAMRRLDGEARKLERMASGLPFDHFLDGERRRSHEYGGMSVFGPAEPVADEAARAPVAPTEPPERVRVAFARREPPSARREKEAGPSRDAAPRQLSLDLAPSESPAVRRRAARS